MKKSISLLQQLTTEGILLVFNICLLILASADNAKSASLDLRKNLGEVMMAINFIAPIASTVLITVKLLLIAKDAYMDYKQSKVANPNQLNKLNIQNVERSVSNQEKKPNQVQESQKTLSQVEALDSNYTHNMGQARIGASNFDFRANSPPRRRFNPLASKTNLYFD